MNVVNVLSCRPDDVLEQGAFRVAAYELTERLDAKVIGATVYEIDAGKRCWPYHYHYGVEEWLYVASGTPLLRDPGGERPLEPGDLVAFSSGPDGAHTRTPSAAPGRKPPSPRKCRNRDKGAAQELSRGPSPGWC